MDLPRKTGLLLAGATFLGILAGWFGHAWVVSRKPVSPTVLEESRPGTEATLIGRSGDRPSTPKAASGDPVATSPTPAHLITGETFPLPRKYFVSAVVRCMDEEFSVTDEAAELLGLDDRRRSQLQGVLDRFKNYIHEQEHAHMEGFRDGDRAAVVISPWAEDPEATRKKLLDEVATVLGPTAGEFFLGQANGILNNLTCHYGGWYRVVRITPQADGRFAIDSINTQDLAVPPNEVLSTDSVTDGASSRGRRTAQDIPAKFSHLFVEE